jgi:hypothetical protein
MVCQEAEKHIFDKEYTKRTITSENIYYIVDKAFSIMHLLLFPSWGR